MERLNNNSMVSFILYWLILSVSSPDTREGFTLREKLSEYNFFQGEMKDLAPADGVMPYEVNTSLFSNYSEKARFFVLPEGGAMLYNDSSVFTFPVGTVLIKNFFYPVDFRKPEKGRIILETRLLVHEKNGWAAYPYIWDEAQREAYYDPAGDRRTVRYVNASGKRIQTSYQIPDKNQCKTCHWRGNAMVPLGLSARQLNRRVTLAGREDNQMKRWMSAGLLEALPENGDVPSGVVWDDPATGSLDARARAYLDANCGHCHRPNGMASTSGLFLDVHQTDPLRLGVNKTPVAAGRGAGNLRYGIVPGNPEKSILVFRMKTNDAAIAMPEIGREQVHAEGVALIEEWIRNGTFAQSQK